MKFGVGCFVLAGNFLPPWLSVGRLLFRQARFPQRHVARFALEPLVFGFRRFDCDVSSIDKAPRRSRTRTSARTPRPSSAANSGTMSTALAFSTSLAARAVFSKPKRAGAASTKRGVCSVTRAEVDRGYGPGSASAAVSADEFYEVTLPKPVGVKFARGNDGGAYVVFVPPEPEYDVFEIGDKIVAVSASFGDEVWGAESYGQVIYAMKNRNGDIYLKMRKLGGDLSALESTGKSSAMAAERNGGNYGAGTKEQQMQNFSKKKELEVQRLDMFDEGISLYNKNDFDGALIVFEEVAALEPKNYMSDSFQMATEIFRVSQYNIACCFSKLGQIDNSLSALKKCMGSGWRDFKKIRTDPSLANVQKAPGFKPMMDKFDEPLINDNAVKFLKGIFGGK